LLTTKTSYGFGPYLLDVDERVLRCDEHHIRLTPKAFDILVFLVSNCGRALTKEELLQEIWPNTYVEEANLAINICALRKVLNRSNGEPEYIQTVRSKGYRFIAEVKREHEIPVLPALEPSSVSGIVIAPSGRLQDLEFQQNAQTVTKFRIPSLRKIKFWPLLAVSTLMGLTVLLYTWKQHDYKNTLNMSVMGSPLDGKARRSIAVLGFENLSQHPDATWLSTALPEMLNTELAADMRLRTIPSEDIARLKAESPLPDTDGFSKSTLIKIHKDLGADYVVTGSYTILDGKTTNRIRLDLRLQDSVVGETIASVAETGDESKLFELVSHAGAQMIDRLVEVNSIQRVSRSVPPPCKQIQKLHDCTQRGDRI
jgi:DNA-binding winged helix-turn-helix (wHTH) protein/TolB-like protein